MRSQLLPLVALVLASLAQSQTYDLSRADSFRQRVDGKVFRTNVSPVWMEDGRFWYSVALPDKSKEIFLVDPSKGSKVRVDKPPVAPPKAGIAPEQMPRASDAGGEGTSLVFVNSTKEDIEIFWLSIEGTLVSYGKIAPGEQREQGTYAGHIWLAKDSKGQGLVAFRAEQGPIVATIEGRVMPTKTPPPVPRPARNPVTFQNSNLFFEGKALTTDGNANDAYESPVVWSPDRSKFAAMKVVPEQEHKVFIVESSPKNQLQPRLMTLDYLKPGDRIAKPRPVIVDAKTGNVTVLDSKHFPNVWEIAQMHWSSDSTELRFRTMERGFSAARLIGANAETGETRVVINEESKTFLDWTNKTFLHPIPNKNEAIWMSERSGWNHLYLYDTATGKVKNPITKGDWVVRNVERVDLEKRQIWLRVGGLYPGQDPYYTHYIRVNFDGSKLTKLTEGDGTHTIKFSPDGKFFIDTWSRVDLPTQTELRRSDTGAKVLTLEKGDDSALTATGWRQPERFVAKARDGVTDIYGVILRPSNFDPKKKYPVIENIYAGPHGAFVPKAFSVVNGMSMLAELGFIVVQVDGLGTNYRSKAFQDVAWKNIADSGFPDRILWMKAAAATRPEMDLTRVGIYGTSAGGQSALGGLLQHGDFYKVGVSDCGCHDNRMDKIWWNEQWMGYPIGKHYEEQSNVTMAPRLKGKLLLMVGEIDTNVDPASTAQVVDALIKADKDFDYLFAPGVGHGVLGTPYGRKRMYEFFIRHLQNTPNE